MRNKINASDNFCSKCGKNSKEQVPNRKTKIISGIKGEKLHMKKVKVIKIMLMITLSVLLLSVCSVSVFAENKEIQISGVYYDFLGTNWLDTCKYEIEKDIPLEKLDHAYIGKVVISSDKEIASFKDENIQVPAYLVKGDELSIKFKYDISLRNADKQSWHINEADEKSVDGIELDNKIGDGALLFQTSRDRKKWVTALKITDINYDVGFDSYINDIQLINGCYYRIILAYELKKDVNANEKKILGIGKDQSLIKRNAEVYEFYALKEAFDTVAIGKTYSFPAMDFTYKTNDNYVGKSKVKNDKNLHYGWELGTFCLSGYTDKGDDNDVYLKTVGNKVKLTFNLKQDIDRLNKNPNLKIERIKDGADGEFQIQAHDMGRGELNIKHTDAEGKVKITKYSNFLDALASPGADTTVQLFEEGDYEVHLDYSIKNAEGIDSTEHYKTSIAFKIRNGNCMVYVFDSELNRELNNGDSTVNGFRIDTAKSSYPQLTIKKEVLNDTKNGLIEDTRFNRAATDGEIVNDEGIYTITAKNRYISSLETTKIIYVGNDNILKAYTKYQNTSNPYNISQLNDLVNRGYTISNDGELQEPVIETTIIKPVTASQPEIETPKPEEKTTIAVSEQSVNSEQSDNPVTEVTVQNEKGNNAVILIICGVLVVIVIVAIAIKNKKK